LTLIGSLRYVLLSILDVNVIVAISSNRIHLLFDVCLHSYRGGSFITQRFLHFLYHSYAHRPFIGFVIYDAAHHYCDGREKIHQTPFAPAVRECARFSLRKSSGASLMKQRSRFFRRIFAGTASARWCIVC
jgi:hypothetical protein